MFNVAGSRVEGRGCKVKGAKGQGSRVRAQIKGQGSRVKGQGSKVQGPRIRAQVDSPLD